MRRLFLSALLIALVIGGIVLVSNIHVNPAKATTNFNGIISSDTTWTKANSPYSLTGNVLVNNGVTLTIQAGVTVNLNAYYIMVNGTLAARGSSTDPIYISGGQITFTQFSTDWNESTSTGSIIENAVLSSTITLNNSPKIDHDITYGAINVQKTTGIPIISNNTIKGGIGVAGNGMPTISSNTVMGQGISLFCSNATVSGNIISGCSAGITAYIDGWDDSHPDAWFNCTSLIEGNLIINNTYGIEIREQQLSKPRSPIVLNNTIANNNIGIYLTWIGLAPPDPAILNNNIYNNSNYNIKLNLPNDINATYNWWGTTNTSLINQTMYDSKNDFNLGTVNFVPFLTEPNPTAPAIPEPEPSPTPSPTQTPTPSASLNPAASPTPSPTISQSPSGTPTPVPNPTPTLNLTCKSSSSYSSFNVEIIGSLTDNGTGLSGSPVLISYSINGGNSWNELTSVNTKDDGSFSAVWLPSVTGNYLIKVTYAGSTQYSQATTIVNFAVTPYQEESVFSVTSNSTLTELSFNSTSKQLSFGVSGDSGTTGYVNAYIPKSLMNDVSGLKVYLDENQISYTTESQSDYWLLHFTYQHSTHKVTITLGTLTNQSNDNLFGSWMFYGALVAIIIIVVVAIVFAVKRMKKKKQN